MNRDFFFVEWYTSCWLSYKRLPLKLHYSIYERSGSTSRRVWDFAYLDKSTVNFLFPHLGVVPNRALRDLSITSRGFWCMFLGWTLSIETLCTLVSLRGCELQPKHSVG